LSIDAKADNAVQMPSLAHLTKAHRKTPASFKAFARARRCQRDACPQPFRTVHRE